MPSCFAFRPINPIKAGFFTALEVKPGFYKKIEIIFSERGSFLLLKQEMEHELLEQIGDVIRFHRKKSGLTQLELANLAGIGKAAVYDMEHKTKSTRIDTLMKVLRVLNIDVKLNSPIMKTYEENRDEKSKSLRSE